MGQTHHLKVKVPIAAELDGQLPHVQVRKRQKWVEYWLGGGREREEEEEIRGKKALSFQASRPVSGGGVTQALHRRTQPTEYFIPRINLISLC